MSDLARQVAAGCQHGRPHEAPKHNSPPHRWGGGGGIVSEAAEALAGPRLAPPRAGKKKKKKKKKINAKTFACPEAANTRTT